MLPNPDFLSKEDVEKILAICEKEKIFLYQVGQICGIRDKGF